MTWSAPCPVAYSRSMPSASNSFRVHSYIERGVKDRVGHFIEAYSLVGRSCLWLHPLRAVGPAPGRRQKGFLLMTMPPGINFITIVLKRGKYVCKYLKI